jgi:hypothetical protein
MEIGTLFTFLFLSIIIVLFSFIYTAICGKTLHNYIKKNHYNRWKKITSIWTFGPGLSNPFRSIPYLFNDEDIEDKEVLKNKQKVKYGLYAILFSFTVMIIIICILIFYLS